MGEGVGAWDFAGPGVILKYIWVKAARWGPT